MTITFLGVYLNLQSCFQFVIFVGGSLVIVIGCMTFCDSYRIDKHNYKVLQCRHVYIN